MPFFKKLAHYRTPKSISDLTEALTKSCEQPSSVLDNANGRYRYVTDGLTGIRVVANPSDAVVEQESPSIAIRYLLTYNESIVFVHRLTRNREKIWTHRNSTF